MKAVGAAVLDPQADHGRDRLVEAARGVEVADADPEVVDPVLAAACLAVMDGLDAVPVRVADKGSVVVGVVVGAEPGRAVVLAAGADRRRVEGVDRVAVGCGEGTWMPAAGSPWRSQKNGLLSRPKPPMRPSNSIIRSIPSGASAAG